MQTTKAMRLALASDEHVALIHCDTYLDEPLESLAATAISMAVREWKEENENKAEGKPPGARRKNPRRRRIKRDRKIGIRVTESELDALIEVARQAGIPAPVFASEAVGRKARRAVEGFERLWKQKATDEDRRIHEEWTRALHERDLALNDGAMILHVVPEHLRKCESIAVPAPVVNFVATLQDRHPLDIDWLPLLRILLALAESVASKTVEPAEESAA